jgi:citrate lyase beta subunit
VQFFDGLDEATRQGLFFRAPEEFGREDGIAVRAMALGATLYVPATKADLPKAIAKRIAQGVRSLVIDLEDAIHDNDVDAARQHTVDALIELGQSPGAQVFVRVRTPDQVGWVTERLLGHTHGLSGFVVPKFKAATGAEYLDEIRAAGERAQLPLLAMPVLETPEVMYRETRDEELRCIRTLLGEYRDIVLAVRVGATDLCGQYGIRRDRDLTIYAVRVASDLISTVVNYLGRAEDGFTVTGTVWEYFANHDRIFRSQLRKTPFDDEHADALRAMILKWDLDALIREILLDKANGLQGKTVIHPSHVPAVHALSVVTHEEFSDASDVLAADNAGGGARASEYRNKMNESKPHRIWAERTMLRARVYGVANPDVTLVHILGALMDT